MFVAKKPNDIVNVRVGSGALAVATRSPGAAAASGHVAPARAPAAAPTPAEAAATDGAPSLHKARRERRRQAAVARPVRTRLGTRVGGGAQAQAAVERGAAPGAVYVEGRGAREAAGLRGEGGGGRIG